MTGHRSLFRDKLPTEALKRLPKGMYHWVLDRIGLQGAVFMRFSRLTCGAFVIGLSALSLAGPAQAQYAAPQIPTFHVSAEDMRAALLPVSENRGVGRVKDNAPNSTGAPKATLMVSFEDGTDRLTVEGMKTLRTLAFVLQDPGLSNADLQIAVHAYAAGDPQLQIRTTRRAQTIAEHLAGFYSVDPARLAPLGLGAQHLVNATNPADPMNNRIEIFNLSAR